MSWKEINRRYGGKDGFHAKGIVLYTPAKQRVTRYRYRGASIPTPWTLDPTADPTSAQARRARYPEQLVIERVQQALA